VLIAARKRNEYSEWAQGLDIYKISSESSDNVFTVAAMGTETGK
jgi:hypothetical protein